MKNKNIKILIFLITLLLVIFIGQTKVKAVFIKNISNAYVSLSNYNYVYTGNAYYPYVTVVYKGAWVSPSNYIVIYRNNINIGTATVIIIAKGGGYIGSTSRTFTISRVNLELCSISLSRDYYTYDGGVKTPIVTITYHGKLVPESDYDVLYSNNVNVGSGLVRIIGKNNYIGTIKRFFIINPQSIDDCDVIVYKTNYQYDGNEKTPGVEVKKGGIVLKQGTHYNVSYSNNVNAGYATIQISGIGNYTGTKSKIFTIEKRTLDNCTAELINSEFTYDGTAKKPGVIVKEDNKILTNNDYKVSYSNNKDAGIATATIKGEGNYKGSIQKTFEINTRNLASCTISLSKKSYIYDGIAKEPNVTVKVGSVKLSKEKCYTLEYSDNIESGTATVKITGIGSVEGEVIKEFKINKRQISKCTVNTLEELMGSEFIYTGEKIEPDLVVKDNDRELIKDADYTISYKGQRILPGKYDILIEGKGNYTGKKRISFEIKKQLIEQCDITVYPYVTVYNGEPIKPNVIVKDGDKKVSSAEYKLSYKNNIDVGTEAEVIVEGCNKLYTGIKKVVFRIVETKSELLFAVAEARYRQMYEEQWAYYHDYNNYPETQKGDSLYWNDIVRSTMVTQITCCATSVASISYLAGILSEEDLNDADHNYNSCNGLNNIYKKHPDKLEPISNRDELREGDIVFFNYNRDSIPDHVAIYAGNGLWYDSGSTNSIRSNEPTSDCSANLNYFYTAYRPIG